MKLLARTSALLFLTIFFVSQGLADTEKGERPWLKLTGAAGTFSGDDFNKALRGYEDYQKERINLYDWTMSGGYKKIRWGLDLEADVVIPKNKWLAIEFGLGYLEASNAQDADELMVQTPDWTESFTDKVRIRAIPIRLGAYISSLISPGVAFFVRGGGGCYLVMTTETFIYKWSNDWLKIDQKTIGGGPGIYGGAGFEFRLSQRMALIIEGHGRYMKIKGLTGTYKAEYSGGMSIEGKGTLYYYEALLDTNNWHPFVCVLNKAPKGATIRSVRKGQVDFSGYALAVGLRIRL